MNLVEATKLVAILKGVYLREPFTEESPKSFLWLLHDKAYDEVLAAAQVHGMRSKWCPTPAELREIITEQLVPIVSGGEGWQVVTKQIGKHGYTGWDSVDFGSDAILEAVKQVGWKRICQDDNSQGYVRRDFETALKNVQERMRRDVQSGAAELAGGEIVQLPRRAS